MEHYDVLIVGNDIGSLAIALYLARKMRKIIVFVDAAVKKTKRDGVDFTDESGNRFTAKVPLLPRFPDWRNRDCCVSISRHSDSPMS